MRRSIQSRALTKSIYDFRPLKTIRCESPAIEIIPSGYKKYARSARRAMSNRFT